MIKSHFMAETDRLLAEKGKYKINWNEAFGGSLYKANATLTSVEEGVTDVGWVFSFLEGAKLPLSQASTYAPFATGNPPVQLKVMWDLMESDEAFKKEWEQYNLKVLGLTGTDGYDVYSKKPITRHCRSQRHEAVGAGRARPMAARHGGQRRRRLAADLLHRHPDRRVRRGALAGARRAAGQDLRGGALHHAGAHRHRLLRRRRHQQGQLGRPARGRAAGDDRRPASSTRIAHAKDLLERHEAAFPKMVELGAGQNPPVTISEMPAADRQKWVDGLPDLAGEWAADAESRGLPGKAFMKAYMDGLRAAGEKPARDWDKAL